MNRQLVCILLLCLISFWWRNAQAVNDFDVRYTVHNFGFADTFIKNTERQYRAQTLNETTTQVCIFCHTPHNASPAVPLWNKNYYAPDAAGYRLYTSSTTLSNTVKHNSSIGPNSPSMLCLSCHDGKTAINVLHNARNRDGTHAFSGDAIIDIGFGINGGNGTAFGDIWTSPGGAYPSNIGAIRNGPDGAISSQTDAFDGTNLTDDHPIGFSYDDVLAEAGQLNDLHTVAEATTPDAYGMKIRFYGPKNNVECSSCHNPHVFYGYGRAGGNRVLLNPDNATGQQKERTPFLVRGNTGSALCLACHKK